MSRRWEYIDRAGELVSVGADRYRIEQSGALVFMDGDIGFGELVLAVAPGSWVTLEPDVTE